MEVKFGTTSEIYPIEKHNDIVITDEEEEEDTTNIDNSLGNALGKHLEAPKEEIDSSTKPKSLLTALIQEYSEDPPHIMIKAKSPPKKHVTLQIPDKEKPVMLAETEIGPVLPQKPQSPKPVSRPPGSEAVGTTVS